ncbi:MAG: hypothetical protein H0V22_00430 [Solirubrobacterales bacterium]|nr:hypothetical protein [Solirubrobacterales bacterium]
MTGEHRSAEPRDDDGDGPARGFGREPGDPLQAFAAQHGVDHLQVHLAQALHESDVVRLTV